MTECLELEEKIRAHVLGLPDYQKRAFEWRLSRSGDCARAMDLDMIHGMPGFDLGHALRLMHGTHIHKMWQELLAQALGDDFTDVEKEVFIEVDGMSIPGHPDGRIKSMNAVYELKTVSDNSFTKALEMGTPFPAHYEQDNMYAHAMGCSNIITHYYNKNTSENLFLLAPYSEEIAKLTMLKFKERKDNMRERKIADRPYHDPTSTPCTYCNHKAMCYQNFEAEVAGMGSQVLLPESNMEVYTAAQQAWLMRAERLKAEKLEEFNKSKLGKFMLSTGFRSIKIGAYVAEIKLGKNKNPLVSVRETKDE